MDLHVILIYSFVVIASLLNKLPELSILTADHKPHIIIVTETLPKHCLYPVQECEFQLPGYQMYTNHDRPSCKRGISAYTRNDVTATIVEILCDYNCSESLWIKIKLKHQDSILVGGIYLSPNTSPDNSGNIRTLLEMANNLKYSHIIVTGDFNMSTTNWELIQATNHMEEDLLEAPNDTAYKRWSCHSGFKLLCKLCRTSPPPAMGARFIVFGHAGHADPQDGWRCCSQKRVMSRPVQVRQL